MSGDEEPDGTAPQSKPHVIKSEETPSLQSEFPRRRERSGSRSFRNAHREALIRTLMYKSPEELELVFRNLEYTAFIAKPKKGQGGAGKVRAKSVRILKGITAQVLPRRLTAILGSSGAGKTVLLSILSGTGDRHGTHVDGTILVNGECYSTGMLRKMTALVRQHNVLRSDMTAREAIEMSAELRLPPTISCEERKARVKALIGLFNLKKVADVPIGSEFVKGLSPAEMKKTMIATEMVMNPAILLLDEPTTGLDSADALNVAHALRGLVHQGRTVMASIHQPGTELFKLFDDVIILCRGRIAYAGPVSKMSDYFARHGYRCPRYVNPPDYVMMNILCEFDIHEGDDELGSPQSEGDVAEPDKRHASLLGRESDLDIVPRAEDADYIDRALKNWSDSQEARELQLRCQYRPHTSVAFVVLKQKAAWWKQLWFLLRRACRGVSRGPARYLFSYVGTLGASLLIGLTYVRTNSFDPSIQIRNKSAVLFLLAGGLFINSSRGLTTGLLRERTTFTSEREAGYYGTGAYYVSKIIVEAATSLVSLPFFLIICYYMIGLTPAFSSYLFMLVLFAADVLCGIAYGAFFGALFDDLPAAINVAYIPYAALGAVSGIFVARVPDWVLWLRYLSPMYYTYSGVLQIQFSGGIPDCDPVSFLCTKREIYQDIEFTPVFSPGVNLVFLIVIFLTLSTSGYLVLLFRVRRGDKGDKRCPEAK